MPRLPPTRKDLPHSPEPSALTADQVDRCADLIADGRGEFPDGLPPTDRARLLAAVRPRLRGRLFRLIARAIAGRLRRPAVPDAEVNADA
jgi:hypothetical protein